METEERGYITSRTRYRIVQFSRAQAVFIYLAKQPPLHRKTAGSLRRRMLRVLMAECCLHSSLPTIDRVTSPYNSTIGYINPDKYGNDIRRQLRFRLITLMLSLPERDCNNKSRRSHAYLPLSLVRVADKKAKWEWSGQRDRDCDRNDETREGRALAAFVAATRAPQRNIRTVFNSHERARKTEGGKEGKKEVICLGMPKGAASASEATDPRSTVASCRTRK
ncbi:hypothetical protein V1478_012600, partial [Vespula squamosa]